MTTATAQITLADVLQFVASHATETDIGAIHDAARMRTKALHAVRAATVTLGANVRFAGLSPKYLNGLSGTVVEISGQRGTVRLDEKSTAALRRQGRRFYIAPTVAEYEMSGVPLSCCITE